jgi:uncharacterized damage-inducible protein DinB
MDLHLDRLLQHVEWADREMISALDRCEVCNERAHKLLAHLIAAEHIWLSRIHAIDIAGFKPWTDLSLSECKELSTKTLAGYRVLIESTPDHQINKNITYHNIQGVEFSTPLSEILLHVALHGAYHRGQIAASMRNAGVEPR